MDPQLSALAARMESHELAVWATCVDAVAELPGNPLSAVIDRSGPVPLVAVCAIDRGDINRVIGLGVGSSPQVADVDDICAFYRDHEQRDFRIEVTPLSRPTGLGAWIAERGLTSDPVGTFKMWRTTEDPPPVADGIDVRLLGPDDAEALTAISVAAWGAWNMPVSMADWFGAAVGREGVRHYGVYEGPRLVATGAMFVDDGLGWLGFDATHPRFQGRKYRQAISSVRMADAAAAGCRYIHAESAVPPTPRALGDGWQLLYEKANFSSLSLHQTVTSTAGSNVGRAVPGGPTDRS